MVPPLATLTGTLLLACCLWSPLWVSLPVSAQPPDSRVSMRASLGILGDGSASGPVSASASDHVEKEDVQPVKKTYNCSQSHRPHSNDSNKFQVLHNQVWWDQVCQIGLVWNQTLCRCDYERETEDNAAASASQCADYRAHRHLSGKYEQQVNGVWLTRDCNLVVAGLVWNQTTCRCAWAPEGHVNPADFERNTPCDTMLNVTFERGLVDEAKSSFLELTSGAILALRHYKRPGSGVNMAAYFQNAVMTVWYFAGNEMSGSLRVEFRFKAEDSPQTRTTYQILLSNGCNVTGLGYTTPTLAVGYRAADRSFLLALHTSNLRKAIVCTRDLDPFAWHHVSLIYEDGTLLFRVDSYPCIISSDFTGEVQKTSCPLTIGADPLEKESKFIGYIDDLLVARHCRRFVEQAPVLSEDGKQDDETENMEKKNNDDDNRGPAQPNSAGKDSASTSDKSSGDNSGQQGDKSDDKSDPRRHVKFGPRGNKYRRRTDKPEQRAVRFDRRGDRPAPRGKFDGRGSASVQHDDKPDPRGDKSDPRGDKSDPRGDKSNPRGGKPAAQHDKSTGSVDNSARYRSNKFSRRVDTPAQRHDNSQQRRDKPAQRHDNSQQRRDKPAQLDDKPARDNGNKPSSSRVDKPVQGRDRSTGHNDTPFRRGDGKYVRRNDRNGRREDDKSPGRNGQSAVPRMSRTPKIIRDTRIQAFRGSMHALA